MREVLPHSCGTFILKSYYAALRKYAEAADFEQIPTKVNGAAAFMLLATVSLTAGIICFAIGLIRSKQSLINISAHFLSWAGKKAVSLRFLSSTVQLTDW